MTSFLVAQQKPLPRLLLCILPEVRFILGLYLLLLADFAVLRGMMLWRNHLQTTGIPTEILSKSFLVGLRFDPAVSTCLLIPLFLAPLILPAPWRRSLVKGFCMLVGLLVWILIISGLAEIEFYRGLEMRFNTLFFEYIGHLKIVAGMVWEDYTVFRYLLALLVTGGVAWFYRRCWPALLPTAPGRRLGGGLAIFCFLALMVVGGRGGRLVMIDCETSKPLSSSLLPRVCCDCPG